MSRKKPSDELIQMWDIIARIRRRLRTWESAVDQLRRCGEDGKAEVLEGACRGLAQDLSD